MKYPIIILSLIFLSLLTTTCTSQTMDYHTGHCIKNKKEASSSWGLTAGPNISWFANGDKNFNGTRHAILGVTAGVYNNIKLSKHWYINPSLLYQHYGAKNPFEYYNSPGSKTNFSTYYIMLPVTLGYKIGFLQINSGVYYGRLVYASNRETFGGGFGWPVDKWTYWDRNALGLKESVQFDLIGALIEIAYTRGLNDVRGKSFNSPRYEGCVNSGVSIGLCVPFSVFKN